MKLCSQCKIEKKSSEFSKDRSRRDGLQLRCKECYRKYQRTYQQTEVGKETYRKASRKYRKNNPEKKKPTMQSRGQYDLAN